MFPVQQLKDPPFPISVCFTTKIIKAHGQYFDAKLGIYLLKDPVFHGQLYVVVSKAIVVHIEREAEERRT